MAGLEGVHCIVEPPPPHTHLVSVVLGGDFGCGLVFGAGVSLILGRSRGAPEIAPPVFSCWNLQMETVEPLNKGHIGGAHSVVPCREAVLCTEVFHLLVR